MPNCVTYIKQSYKRCVNRVKPPIIFWRGIEVKAALDEEALCHWTTTAMSLLDSPVPAALTSETKAIILVVAPSATARIRCAASGLAHAGHNKGGRTIKQ